ncbi:DUF2637 domain-containing protein [Streptomyces sp. So13.3]|uniref:DUF2637 domain-containing protein n=1 Tax=Streptomyces sp. So13.3 TaxID=2136173 RepID=UPI001105D900|nr:DUF2637 domain-containing protein [Streptomyces sp. So13.3]QNA74186.1 DUF2637 domain-containing protein [Streptomyces sp. So13.3]
MAPAPVAAPPLSKSETALLSLVTVAAVIVGAFGLATSFEAVTAAGSRWGFTAPWMLPIGIDVAIPVFTAVNLLLIRMDMPLGWVRFVPWALTGVTCLLNVAAGRSVWAKLAHGTMPLLWVVLSEVAAHVYATRIGAVTGRRIEKIRRSRWLLAPLSTFALWRRMTLWEITGYADALARERDRQLIRADLREEHGRAWRRKTPRRTRVLLKIGELSPARELEGELSPDPGSVRKPLAEHPARQVADGANAQVAPNNPPPVKEPVKARRKQVPAARTAAAHTARATDPEEQAAARAWVARRLSEGHEVSWRELAAECGRGETWCRARIRETKNALTIGSSISAESDHVGLHLVPVGGDQ